VKRFVDALNAQHLAPFDIHDRFEQRCNLGRLVAAHPRIRCRDTGLGQRPCRHLILHRLMVARHKRRIEESDGSLPVQASRNRHWNLWLPRGLLTRHAAKQSQQHHHPEANRRHAGIPMPRWMF
jgi:hypothetical protein